MSPPPSSARLSRVQSFLGSLHIAARSGTGSREPARAPLAPEPTGGPLSSTSTIAVEEPCPQGLAIITEGTDPVIDIVAVHGLNGHRDTTWTASNGVHWLRDLLPHDIPQARIFSWGYDADLHAADSPVNCKYLCDHALALVFDLCRERQLTDTMERPIIFIAHSLGGILVKSALVYSEEARGDALQEQGSIKVSTHGIIFMGTPHDTLDGGPLSEPLKNIASIFVRANNPVLKQLKRDSKWLQQQLHEYEAISEDFATKFAYEEFKTPIASGRSVMIVPRASAVVRWQVNTNQFGVPADHCNMVKYATREHTGYTNVLKYLQLLVRAAPDATRVRWEAARRSDETHPTINPSPAGLESSATFMVGFSLSDVAAVDHFVARDEEISHLYAILNPDFGRRAAVVHGPAGMGKTQLAVAYAKRHQHDYSAVFWLNARDKISLKQSFARVARRILSEHPSVEYVRNAVESGIDDKIVRAVRRWLDQLKNDNWLMIYDNYDNPKLETGRDHQADKEEAAGPFNILPFLPNLEQGAVLITTRSPQVDLGGRIPLGKLQLEASLEILSSVSGRQNLDKNPGATELAQDLDGGPLALSMAGAYLSNLSVTFAQYLEYYRSSLLDVQWKNPRLSSDQQALYSILNISYAQIRRQSLTSAMLLRLWAYFDHEDLWFQLLEKGYKSGPPWFQDSALDEVGFNEAVRVLCNYGLVEAVKEGRQKPSRYSMHGCVHRWTRHILNKKQDASMARLAIRCVVAHVEKQPELEYWVLPPRLMAHASRCLPMATQDESLLSDEADVRTLNKLGLLYLSQGPIRVARTMLKRALRGYEKTLGPEHQSTLDTRHYLANITARYTGYPFCASETEAREVLKRVLQAKEKALGPEHASTFATMDLLGNFYIDHRRYKDARAIHTRALRSKEKALGPDHVSTLSSVNNLAHTYSCQGRLGEAEVMYNQALRGTEKALGRQPPPHPDQPSTLPIVHNLAVFYWGRGRLDDAEAMFKRCLGGYEKALGNHVETFRPALEMIRDYVGMLKTAHKLSEASALYQRWTTGHEALFDVDPDLCDYLYLDIYHLRAQEYGVRKACTIL